MDVEQGEKAGFLFGSPLLTLIRVNQLSNKRKILVHSQDTGR